MTRPTDAIKEVRSYTVHRDPNTKQWGVKASHWEVGYTPAYCATKLEAVDHAIEAAKEQFEAATEKIWALRELRDDLLEEGVENA